MPIVFDACRIIRHYVVNGLNFLRKLKANLTFTTYGIIRPTYLIFVTRAVSDQIDVANFVRTRIDYFGIFFVRFLQLLSSRK